MRFIKNLLISWVVVSVLIVIFLALLVGGLSLVSDSGGSDLQRFLQLGFYETVVSWGFWIALGLQLLGRQSNASNQKAKVKPDTRSAKPKARSNGVAWAGVGLGALALMKASKTSRNESKGAVPPQQVPPSQQKWEFQIEDGGSWKTINSGSGHYTNQQVDISLTNLKNANPGRRVRALCNGALTDMR